MKSLIIAALAFVILSGSARSQTAPAVTPEMQAMEAKLLTHVGAETRSWIKQEAAKQKTSATFTGQLDQQALDSYPYASTLGQSDIDALMFLVMMESSRSSSDDLKASMNEIKKTNAAKASTRQSRNQEVGNSESLRRQTAMDHRSKFVATLSNMMKKMSDTNSMIVSNLK